MSKYLVLFDDDDVVEIKARNIDDAWENANDIVHSGKIVDVWKE